MGRGYEIVNNELIIVKPRMNMCLVENFCALSLGEDEVEEETESKPWIKGYPKKKKKKLLLDGISGICSSRENDVCEPN